VAVTGTGFACGSRRTSLARRKAGGTGTELIFCVNDGRVESRCLCFGMVHIQTRKYKYNFFSFDRRVITQGTYHRVHIGYIVTFNAFTWHPACP
jgi:hypothetical protein